MNSMCVMFELLFWKYYLSVLPDVGVTLLEVLYRRGFVQGWLCERREESRSVRYEYLILVHFFVWHVLLTRGSKHRVNRHVT